jgi:hypothetical protein
MIATPHMLTGAAVALRTRSVPQAVAIGAASHLLLDMVPHVDYPLFAGKGLVLAADLLGGAGLTMALVEDDPVLWAGAFGGILPDLLAVAERTIQVRITRRPHERLHTRVKPGPATAAKLQTLAALSAASVLFVVGTRRTQQRSEQQQVEQEYALIKLRKIADDDPQTAPALNLS